MCSISGFYKRNKNFNYNLLTNIIVNSELRGKDSFGITYILDDNTYITDKKLGKPSDYTKFLKNMECKIIINNNRAEPTTEYVANKSLNDIQPFDYEGIIVAHNGVVSNDKNLQELYNLKRSTKIDTAIIPPLLKKIWDGKDVSSLIDILINKLIGSYALSIWDERNPDVLWLATNYKPLYLYIIDENIYFSSLKEFFGEFSYQDLINKNIKIIEIKPYTLLKIDKYFIEDFSLYKKDYSINIRKKSLIIASSGLDSTVAISWAIKQGYEVELLHFQYSCRASDKELLSIKKISDFFKVKLTIINIDFFKNVIKNSRLISTKESLNLVKTNNGEDSSELAWEWVPARNLIFMSIAAGFSEANDIDYIILGGNLEESGAYADNELIFQKKFNDILPNSLNLQHKLEVLTPMAGLMKKDIVKLGIELGSPLHLTWSCYENSDRPCGKCGPDFMRKTAFKMNGYKDMLDYDFIDIDFFKGCESLILDKEKKCWVIK